MAKSTVSERGPRNAKLTVLVPSEVLDDLRVLREVTRQSTGDLVNRLVEAELRKQSDLIREAREMLRARDEWLERIQSGSRTSVGSAERPPEASSGSKGGRAPKFALGPGESIPAPSEDDLQAWAAEASGDNAVKRRKEGGRFLEYIRTKGCDHVDEAVLSEYKAEVLDSLYPNSRTASTWMAFTNGFMRWSKGRL